MRLLHAPHTTNPVKSHQSGLNQRLQAGREASIHGFTRSFLASLPACLVQSTGGSDSEQRYLELSEIVSDLVALSSRLSTQREQVLVKNLRDLAQPNRPVRFYAASKTLQHHAMHNLQIEDSEHSLDGRRVLLVVHPLIMAFSNKAGGPPISERVWKRAIVWVGA